MLSERSQAQKATYRVIHLYEISRTGKSSDTDSGFLKTGGRGHWGETA